MHRNALLASTILGSLFLVAGGLYVWKFRPFSHAAPQAGGFEPPQSVQIVNARQVRWRPMADLVGTVVAKRFITLSNEIAGRVNTVEFESGAVVREGQTLLTLDAQTELADLAAADASVRVSQAAAHVVEANIKLWESNVRRIAAAVESRAAAETELDSARAQLDSGRAQLDRARAEVDQAKARLEQIRAILAKKTIRAPFTARAGIRNTHPGQYLPEGTSIVGLQEISESIYLDFAIPQEYAKRVRVGESVLATSSMVGAEPFRVNVVAMDAVADRTTRNIRVRTELPNPNERFRPGMFVDVSVPAGEESEYIAVPNTAVRRAPFGDHVFLIAAADPTGSFRAKQQFVRLGPAVGADVIITEGLKPGDEIAAAGSFKLHDGSPVLKLPEGSTPSNTAEAPTKAPGGS